MSERWMMTQCRAHARSREISLSWYEEVRAALRLYRAWKRVWLVQREGESPWIDGQRHNNFDRARVLQLVLAFEDLFMMMMMEEKGVVACERAGLVIRACEKQQALVKEDG